MESCSGDIESLVRRALSVAETVLNSQGHFYPFAVVLTSHGETDELHVDEGFELPPPDEAVKELRRQLRVRANDREIRATIICSDGDGAGEIQLHAEDISGTSFLITQRYNKRVFRSITFGERSASPTEGRIFVALSP